MLSYEMINANNMHISIIQILIQTYKKKKINTSLIS